MFGWIIKSNTIEEIKFVIDTFSKYSSDLNSMKRRGKVCQSHFLSSTRNAN